jgi:hypothetical protein
MDSPPRQELSVSQGAMRVFLAAQVVFVSLALYLTVRVVEGAARHQLGWWLPVAAVAGLLIADFVSGFVHFLADNFCEADTPIIGKTFVRPFREHHADPLAITTHGFVEANGGNTIVSLPVLAPVALLVPIEDGPFATMVGALTLAFIIPIWLTNQIHKWAHMVAPPRIIRAIQRTGLILANKHHDVHHTSPFDTYYCITVGFWNPFLERIGLWERLERWIRRWVPGTDPVSRVERDAAGRTIVAAGAVAVPRA